MNIIEQILSFDTELFLFFNKLHTPFFDVLMKQISSKLIWVPLYLIVLFFIFRKYKIKKGLLIFLFFILVITLTDQISVHLFKNIFQRLRPCYETSIQNLVHYLSLPGGHYGFVSSHAANSFGFAFFSLLIFKNKKYSVFILFWASLVSYSRIYLGVHYPADIVGGAILGVVISLLIYELIKPILRNYN